MTSAPFHSLQRCRRSFTGRTTKLSFLCQVKNQYMTSDPRANFLTCNLPFHSLQLCRKQPGRRSSTGPTTKLSFFCQLRTKYKIRCLGKGIAWESVKDKYKDILVLFKGELPATEEEKDLVTKDYPHLAEQVTKEVLSSKLKAIRSKYREVRFGQA